MSRYIDLDKAIERLKASPAFSNMGTDGYFLLDVVENLLNKQPTADVVEVVRCKDCKHLYCLSAIDRRFYCRHYPHGLEGINIIEDNPYCSYGERREE